MASKMYAIYSKAYDANKTKPLFKQVVMIEDKDVKEVEKTHVVVQVVKKKNNS